MKKLSKVMVVETPLRYLRLKQISVCFGWFGSIPIARVRWKIHRSLLNDGSEKHRQESKSVHMTTRGAALIWQNSFCSIDYSYFGLRVQGLLFLLKSTYAHTIHMHTHRIGEIETLSKFRIKIPKWLKKKQLFPLNQTIAVPVYSL